MSLNINLGTTSRLVRGESSLSSKFSGYFLVLLTLSKNHTTGYTCTGSTKLFLPFNAGESQNADLFRVATWNWAMRLTADVSSLIKFAGGVAP